MAGRNGCAWNEERADLTESMDVFTIVFRRKRASWKLFTHCRLVGLITTEGGKSTVASCARAEKRLHEQPRAHLMMGIQALDAFHSSTVLVP